MIPAPPQTGSSKNSHFTGELIGILMVLFYALISYPEQNLRQSRLAVQHKVIMVIYPSESTSVVVSKIQG